MISNTASVTSDSIDPTFANASANATAASIAMIPTLSEWMLLLLAAMLGVVALRNVGRVL